MLEVIYPWAIILEQVAVNGVLVLKIIYPLNDFRPAVGNYSSFGNDSRPAIGGELQLCSNSKPVVGSDLFSGIDFLNTC